MILDAVVLVAGGATLGFLVHRWWCMRRNGCPIWGERKTQEWEKWLERRYPTGRFARRPSTEVATVQVLADVVDKQSRKGAPSKRWETPDVETPTPAPTKGKSK